MNCVPEQFAIANDAYINSSEFQANVDASALRRVHYLQRKYERDYDDYAVKVYETVRYADRLLRDVINDINDGTQFGYDQRLFSAEALFNGAQMSVRINELDESVIHPDLEEIVQNRIDRTKRVLRTVCGGIIPVEDLNQTIPVEDDDRQSEPFFLDPVRGPSPADLAGA